ncbi:MAG: ABC transporter ATP-binding protein [Proteobacteria bacterium]|nr:ABC transporter ATP-binding protein [Pseudomonadota bacterium]
MERKPGVIDDEDDDEEDDEDFEDDEPSEAERLRVSLRDVVPAMRDLGRFLAPYLARRPKALWLLAGCIGVETAFNVAFPLCLKYLLDSVLDEERWETLVLLLGLLGALGAVAAVAMVAGEWLNARLGASAMSRIRQDLFDRIQQVKLGFIARTQSGRILSRLSNDVQTIDAIVMHGADWGLLPLLELVGAIALLFWLSPVMAIVAMTIFPLTLLGPRLIAPRAVEAGYVHKRQTADALSTAGESLGAQKLIRAFALQRRIGTWYRGRNARVRHAAFRVRFFEALIERSASISVLILHLAIFGFGAVLTFDETISVGTFIAFESVFWELSYNIVHLTQFVPELVAGAGALKHLDEFRNAPTAPEETPGAPPAEPFRREIRFENVGFDYDESERGLSGVSFAIPAGSRIGIVGESGSGKSTLLMMLLRLHHPKTGRILIDGIDMAEVSGDSVRAMMGIVFQDNVLFGTTIRENIRLGRRDATDGDIVAAAKQAGIHRFIRSLPDRYDTVLGERGDTLSQGQRQRIGIARAMIRNPAILLLDEATSALDSATRTEILATLAKVGKDRTLVTVTHDLASVVACDRIFVLSEGRLVQQGSHAELVASDGPYRRLWRQTPSGAGA